MGENPTQQPKIYFIFAIKEIPFNRFKSFPIKSLISSPSNINFQVIILCNLHLQLQSFLVYHFLNLQLYIHTCHANLTKQCLLNVAFSMTKASKLCQAKFTYPPFLQCYFENPVSIITWFPLFHTHFFISNFIKFQLTPAQLRFHGLWANQI